jgi:hypothetical protein
LSGEFLFKPLHMYSYSHDERKILKIVQTWWLCERRISSMRASTQNHNRKRVHHCSWEAMQMTSSSRDITVMWSIGTKNISCSWTQHQLQHQLVFLTARKALPNLVIIVCCMAAVIWGDRTSPVSSFLLVQQQVLWFVDEKKTNDDRKWTHLDEKRHRLSVTSSMWRE